VNHQVPVAASNNKKVTLHNTMDASGLTADQTRDQHLTSLKQSKLLAAGSNGLMSLNMTNSEAALQTSQLLQNSTIRQDYQTINVPKNIEQMLVNAPENGLLSRTTMNQCGLHHSQSYQALKERPQAAKMKLKFLGDTSWITENAI
jgi:hypothetical protein